MIGRLEHRAEGSDYSDFWQTTSLISEPDVLRQRMKGIEVRADRGQCDRCKKTGEAFWRCAGVL